MDDLVYQKNKLCLIILGHNCRWKILKLSHFMLSQVGETPQFVILQGGGTLWMMWYIKKIGCV